HHRPPSPCSSHLGERTLLSGAWRIGTKRERVNRVEAGSQSPGCEGTLHRPVLFILPRRVHSTPNCSRTQASPAPPRALSAPHYPLFSEMCIGVAQRRAGNLH